MYLNFACLVLFISSSSAIPLKAIGDVGIQSRSVQGPASLKVTFPNAQITDSENPRAALICGEIQEALKRAADGSPVIPEWKGAGFSCDTHARIALSKKAPREIPFQQTVFQQKIPFQLTTSPYLPRSKDSPGVCEPSCSGVLGVVAWRIGSGVRFKLESVTLSGREVVFEDKGITQMIIISDVDVLETPSSSNWRVGQTHSSKTDVPASSSKSGTRINVNVGYSGPESPTKEKMESEVEKLFTYIPHVLPEMVTPLVFEYKPLETDFPQGDWVDTSDPQRKQYHNAIYFTFTSSPGLGFCEPRCDGRIWNQSGHKGNPNAMILGPRATFQNSGVEMRVQRVIKFSPASARS
ncbi:hypothetical protein F5880DRAFT_1610124 [Lentinula raphanica]|nr:hypothetical protein F5880DRAFT_1610124 [Lentinula raphanica]